MNILRSVCLIACIIYSNSIGYAESGLATGRVFHDKNGNLEYDRGEKTLKGVRVSNGVDIVKTKGDGTYELNYNDTETIFFVIKPRKWRSPVDDNNLPKFYYHHCPEGALPLKYPGTQPTGPLPRSIDFPMYPQNEPDKFRAIVFADPQPRNQKEIDYISHDVIEPLIGVDAAFGVTLGDIMFDKLSLFGSLNASIALIGIPWYNVVGNHDINFDAPDDYHANQTFKETFGPPYYSFNYGKAHFIVLDNIFWQPATEGKRGKYSGRIDEQQLEFVRNDLKEVPKNQLVVLLMHIPLPNVENREEIYRLIENRPFSMSISGHTHYQKHVFIDEGDGWRGKVPHHHLINVTVSGSWWRGAKDERGIPMTPMRDGAPNGYSIISFDGVDYEVEFRAAHKPADYQMSIDAPDSVSVRSTGQTEFTANIFGGSEKSTVHFRIGGKTSWNRMDRVEILDPKYVRLKEMEASQPPKGRGLPKPIKSSHIWSARLPANLGQGTYEIEVRSKDMFDNETIGRRIFRVFEPREGNE